VIIRRSPLSDLTLIGLVDCDRLPLAASAAAVAADVVVVVVAMDGLASLSFAGLGRPLLTEPVGAPDHKEAVSEKGVLKEAASSESGLPAATRRTVSMGDDDDGNNCPGWGVEAGLAVFAGVTGLRGGLAGGGGGGGLAVFTGVTAIFAGATGLGLTVFAGVTGLRGGGGGLAIFAGVTGLRGGGGGLVVFAGVTGLRGGGGGLSAFAGVTGLRSGCGGLAIFAGVTARGSGPAAILATLGARGGSPKTTGLPLAGLVVAVVVVSPS